jgi:hypothetical protein
MAAALPWWLAFYTPAVKLIIKLNTTIKLSLCNAIEIITRILQKFIVQPCGLVLF